MFANTKTLAVIAACVVAAHAQSSTTATAPASQSSLPAGLDTCILNCVTNAATANGCASFTDLACVCTNTAFQGAALACLQANCTAQDVATATQLQSQECAAFMSSAPATGSMAPTGSAAPTGSSAPMSSGSAGSASKAASSTGAPAATTSTSAAGVVAPFSFHTLVGALVASAGALIGGALVL